MLARATAATPWGIEARPVQVEVDVHNGLPQVQIVGLPDAAKRLQKAALYAGMRADHEAMKRDKWGGYTGYDRWFAKAVSRT